jgi:allantoinase
VSAFDAVLRSKRVVTPEGEQAAAVCVRDGTIVALEPYDAALDAARTVDLGEDALLPGLVDTHVHVNEPGRTEWEGFDTATRAAAAGGVTTILDMPLNSIPPTVSVQALQAKRQAADGGCWVDVGFWGGVVPGNAGEFPGLHAAGVFGFKCFRVDSGVEEFPSLDGPGLEAALRELARLGALLIEHAELPEPIAAAPNPGGPRYWDYLASRPQQAEDGAVAELVELCRRTSARAHVVHLSSADALPTLRAAHADGVTVTAETCPHYLCLTAEEVPDGATQFKCAPPIREAANREALWGGLEDGTILCVVSDHSPCPPELKRLNTRDFGQAWGGISSLQLRLPLLWSEASKRGHTLTDVVRWTASEPARLVRLTRKGAIQQGFDADLVIFAPEETFTVQAGNLHHRHPLTPYHGRTLRGVVRATWLRGAPVGNRPRGRLLRRGEA